MPNCPFKGTVPRDFRPILFILKPSYKLKKLSNILWPSFGENAITSGPVMGIVTEKSNDYFVNLFKNPKNNDYFATLYRPTQKNNDYFVTRYLPPKKDRLFR